MTVHAYNLLENYQAIGMGFQEVARSFSNLSHFMTESKPTFAALSDRHRRICTAMTDTVTKPIRLNEIPLMEITKEMIELASNAYAEKRSPERWDGKPWGEAGQINHEAAIKNALEVIFKNYELVKKYRQ